jgi:hypothetical protein
MVVPEILPLAAKGSLEVMTPEVVTPSSKWDGVVSAVELDASGI